MAYTGDFVPATRIVLAQDGMGFRLYDDSVWGIGDQALTELCTVSIVHIDDDEDTITYDDYELIVGVTRTKFDEYLTTSGHLIEIANLLISGVAAGVVFTDGYYEITTTYKDDTVTTQEYLNTQAFLAKYRFMKRTMPALLLTWPITLAVREKNYDIYTLGLYLVAAEDAADLGKKVEFRKFIALIRGIVDHYVIAEPW